MPRRATQHANVDTHSLVLKMSHGVRRTGAGLMILALACVGIRGFAADSLLDNLKQVGTGWGGGEPTKDVGTIIGGVIQVVLGFLGVVFLILALYAGFQWMTAGGDSKKVETAQKTLTAAVIGLVIIAAAQGLTYWVLTTIATQIIQ